MNQFKLIIDFLIAEGAEFATPYGYYQSLNSSTGLNAVGFHNTELQISSNPASTKISLKYEASESSKVQIDIYTLDGKKLKTIIADGNRTNDGNNLKINILELNKGIYLLQLTTGISVYSSKFIRLLAKIF